MDKVSELKAHCPIKTMKLFYDFDQKKTADKIIKQSALQNLHFSDFSKGKLEKVI